MTSLILKNCTIVDTNFHEPREGKEVLIENEWIKEINDSSIHSDDAQVIDLKGMTLIPGLIDAHCHIILSDLNISNTDNFSSTMVSNKGFEINEGNALFSFHIHQRSCGADSELKAAQEQSLIKRPKLWIAERSLRHTCRMG